MFHTIDAAALNAMLGEQLPPQLVDVRTQAEVARGAIAGSRHIELATLPARMAELDPESPCVIYCLSGARAAQACMFLAQRGYARVYNLQGGIAAWTRAGLPVTG